MASQQEAVKQTMPLALPAGSFPIFEADLVAAASRIVRSGGTVAADTDVFTGPQGSYLLTLQLPDPEELQAALRISFSIANWAHIRYVAFGWVDTDGVFQHLKARHIENYQVYTECISPDHPLFEHTNGTPDRPSSRKVSAVRIYVSGTPCDNGAEIDLLSVSHISYGRLRYYDAVRAPQYAFDIGHYPAWAGMIESGLDHPTTELMTAYADRLVSGPAIVETTQESAQTRLAIRLTAPVSNAQSTQARRSQHALRHVASALKEYASSRDPAPLFSAHVAFNAWYDCTIATASTDPSLAWEDKAIAARAAVLIMLYRAGIHAGFDVPTKARLLYALSMHADLLASSVCYASSHDDLRPVVALEQDAVLLGLSGVFSDAAQGPRYAAIARERARRRLTTFRQDSKDVTPETEEQVAHLASLLRALDHELDFSLGEFDQFVLLTNEQAG